MFIGLKFHSLHKHIREVVFFWGVSKVYWCTFIGVVIIIYVLHGEVWIDFSILIFFVLVWTVMVHNDSYLSLTLRLCKDFTFTISMRPFVKLSKKNSMYIERYWVLGWGVINGISLLLSTSMLYTSVCVYTSVHGFDGFWSWLGR